MIPQNLSTLLISTHGHGGLLARNRISTFFCHGLDSILLSSFPYLMYSRAFGLKIGIIHFHPFGTHTTLRKIPLCVSSSYFLEWSPHLHCHRLKVKGKLPFVHWGHVSIHLSEVDTTSSLHLVYERPYQWALIILQTARKKRITEGLWSDRKTIE